MTRQDLLLGIIAAADGARLTPTQLQKVAFLLGEEFRDEMPEDYYRFEEEAFGPFSDDVYSDAEALRRAGRIDISINLDGGWKEYAFIGRGNRDMLARIPKHIASYIDDTTRWARQIGFWELVREIIRRYPEYREYSVFAG